MEYGIIGETYGTDLPETELEETRLIPEKNAARFSKSKEYKALKEHLEARIKFYQTQLPDGRTITEAKSQDWIVANLVIAEFQAVIDAYEGARRVVENG